MERRQLLHGYSDVVLGKSFRVPLNSCKKLILVHYLIYCSTAAVTARQDGMTAHRARPPKGR